jgi:hypothetical protein
MFVTIKVIRSLVEIKVGEALVSSSFLLKGFLNSGIKDPIHLSTTLDTNPIIKSSPFSPSQTDVKCHKPFEFSYCKLY